MYKKEALLTNFPVNIRRLLSEIDEADFEEISEIRLRPDRPVSVIYMGRERYIGKDGRLGEDDRASLRAEQKDIENTFMLLSSYSEYAFEEDIKRGFITIPGGHRAGVSGKVVTENGKVKTLSRINGICLRLSREVRGCSDKVMDYIFKDGQVMHTMIISPPGCGKTTILRDIIRQLSDVGRKNISLIDERSEIAGCHMGIPQRDVGKRTDVMDSCPKSLGMLMALRSLAPDVIAVDEIGGREDVCAIEEILNAGVKLVCTVHGKDCADIKRRPYLSELIETEVFERYIILSKKRGFGTLEGIYDSSLKEVI